MAIKPLINTRWSTNPVGVLVALALALQACVSVPPRNPLPEELVDQATVPGGPTARFWGDARPVDMDARFDIFRTQLAASADEDVYTRSRHYLSISGGGADGAFGAGLLKGWSESGTRPEIMIVTGISTGALIAPFAFIGSDYDDELEDLYTTMSTSDLIKKRSLIAGLTSDALLQLVTQVNSVAPARPGRASVTARASAHSAVPDALCLNIVMVVLLLKISAEQLVPVPEQRWGKWPTRLQAGFAACVVILMNDSTPAVAGQQLDITNPAEVRMR